MVLLGVQLVSRVYATKRAARLVVTAALFAVSMALVLLVVQVLIFHVQLHWPGFHVAMQLIKCAWFP